MHAHIQILIYMCMFSPYPFWLNALHCTASKLDFRVRVASHVSSYGDLVEA